MGGDTKRGRYHKKKTFIMGPVNNRIFLWGRKRSGFSLMAEAKKSSGDKKGETVRGERMNVRKTTWGTRERHQTLRVGCKFISSRGAILARKNQLGTI